MLQPVDFQYLLFAPMNSIRAGGTLEREAKGGFQFSLKSRSDLLEIDPVMRSDRFDLNVL
jgi:hypothetical protein